MTLAGWHGLRLYGSQPKSQQNNIQSLTNKHIHKRASVPACLHSKLDARLQCLSEYVPIVTLACQDSTRIKC